MYPYAQDTTKSRNFVQDLYTRVGFPPSTVSGFSPRIFPTVLVLLSSSVQTALAPPKAAAHRGVTPTRSPASAAVTPHYLFIVPDHFCGHYVKSTHIQLPVSGEIPFFGAEQQGRQPAPMCVVQSVGEAQSGPGCSAKCFLCFSHDSHKFALALIRY